jgi:hypothetical protein
MGSVQEAAGIRAAVMLSASNAAATGTHLVATFAQPLKNYTSRLIPCGPLLIPQGHHGVHLGRAPRRDVAGEQRDAN